MYRKFFGFKELPFKLAPDPRFFFSSKKHEEAFSHILYGLKERKGFIVITGEVGTGKTTLCRLLLSRLDPSVRTALLFNPQLTSIELLQSVNQDFGLKGEGNSKKVLLDELNRFLLDLLAKGENALLVIDEAQLLTIELLEEIRLLSNLETDQAKLIQILLVGQPELREKLAMKELRQLKQRISLWCEIEPLGREEVEAYLQARLQAAGGGDKVRFAPQGVDRIYRFSRGFPRLINIIADQSLLAAYVAGATYVNNTLVQQAAEEIQRGEGGRRSPPIPGWRLGGKKAIWGGISVALLSVFALAGLWGWREGLFSVSPLNGEGQTIQPEEKAPLPEISGAIEPSSDTDEVFNENAKSETAFESPVVPPPPSPFSVPPPSSAPLWDEAGIFRVGAVSETEKGAYLTLLNLWSPLTSDEEWRERGMEEISQWMAERGRHSYKISLNLKKVLLLNYPLLFALPEEEGLHYQVLAKVEEEEAVLLDPLSGEKRVPLAQLAQGWKGSGVVLWSEIEGVRLPLRKNGPDPSVKKIQEALWNEGLFQNVADGIWGAQTRQAIRFFQEKSGLDGDGLFGMETYLLLAKRVSPRVPSLQ